MVLQNGGDKTIDGAREKTSKFLGERKQKERL